MAAVMALRVHNGSETIPALTAALAHPRCRVREAALAALVERQDFADRMVVLKFSQDQSADVRLALANLMGEHQWPEAVDALVKLLHDRRDFSTYGGYGGGDHWSRFAVARAAAQALGAYAELPAPAIEVLLERAGDYSYADPFVACAALEALANKDDTRIEAALLDALSSPGLRGAAGYHPIAQAAAWGIFDRVMAGHEIGSSASLAEAALDAAYEIAAPLLMVLGFVGGAERSRVISELDQRGLDARRDLVLIAAAADTGTPPDTLEWVHEALVRLTDAGALEKLVPEDQEGLIQWSLALDPEDDVQKFATFLASALFKLPVREQPVDLRAYRLPKRIPVLSLSPAPERLSGHDDGR